MSDQEGTPKKHRKLGSYVYGKEKDSSDCKKAPSTSSRQSDDETPISPLQSAAHSRSTPCTPLKHAEYRSSPFTPVKHIHSGSPSTPSRHQLEGNLTTTPVKFKLSPARQEKLAHLKDTVNKPSPAFPVEEHDVDMQDADNPVPSKSFGSPISPFQPVASTSTQSLRNKLIRQLGIGFNSVTNSLLQCVKQPNLEPESEPKSKSESEPEPKSESKPQPGQENKAGVFNWVCNYKLFSEEKILLKKKFEKIAPHETHLVGLSIPDVFCFEMSTRKVKSIPPQWKKKLGACVTFSKERSLKCREPICSACDLFACNACLHQYVCDCTSKEEHAGEQWCAHIHVAHDKNLNVYGAEACLFILEDYSNLTKKRHIRAIIQGPKKMFKVATNLYMEDFQYLKRSKRYHVRINVLEISEKQCTCKPAKKCKHCGACWCRYSCTCEDYWYERQVCEHVHNVAMQEKMKKEKSSKNLFDFDTFEAYEKKFKEKESKDKPSAEDAEKERTMNKVHELSHEIPVKDVQEVIEDYKWVCFSEKGEIMASVYIGTEWLDKCICNKAESTKGDMCVICKICKFHYSCDCTLMDGRLDPICCHMHAVARFRRENYSDEDTVWKQKLKYHEKLMEQLEEKRRHNKEKPTRQPTGVMESCSESSTPTSSSATSQQEN